MRAASAAGSASVTTVTIATIMAITTIATVAVSTPASVATCVDVDADVGRLCRRIERGGNRIGSRRPGAAIALHPRRQSPIGWRLDLVAAVAGPAPIVREIGAVRQRRRREQRAPDDDRIDLARTD